jgi:hypothetical protein
MWIAPGVQPDIAAETFQKILAVDGVAHGKIITGCSQNGKEKAAPLDGVLRILDDRATGDRIPSEVMGETMLMAFHFIFDCDISRISNHAGQG